MTLLLLPHILPESYVFQEISFPIKILHASVVFPRSLPAILHPTHCKFPCHNMYYHKVSLYEIYFYVQVLCYNFVISNICILSSFLKLRDHKTTEKLYFVSIHSIFRASASTWTENSFINLGARNISSDIISPHLTSRKDVQESEVNLLKMNPRHQPWCELKSQSAASA